MKAGKQLVGGPCKSSTDCYVNNCSSGSCRLFIRRKKNHVIQNIYEISFKNSVKVSEEPLVTLGKVIRSSFKANHHKRRENLKYDLQKSRLNWWVRSPLKMNHPLKGWITLFSPFARLSIAHNSSYKTLNKGYSP